MQVCCYAAVVLMLVHHCLYFVLVCVLRLNEVTNQSQDFDCTSQTMVQIQNGNVVSQHLDSKSQESQPPHPPCRSSLPNKPLLITMASKVKAADGVLKTITKVGADSDHRAAAGGG